MKKKEIAIVIGTRPQIIKSQPLISNLKSHNLKTTIIYTGQHYDYGLPKKIFKDLEISNPSYNLDIGRGSSINQISEIILKLEKILSSNQPDLVIIPGDTTSAIAAAMATSKLKIKLAHLEAGARSNQFYMAEEVNRRMIDHCSNLLFAPTKNCLANLKRENVFGQSYFVGDTMYDLFVKLKKNFKRKSPNSSPKILVTFHRIENIQNIQNLKKICKILNQLNKNFDINFPVHPHTKKILNKENIKIKFKILEPLGYIEMMRKINESTLVITDSGGLQKEAYWMGKPCVTVRENTEWTETVKEGANFIMPISKEISIKKLEKISSIKVKTKGSLFGNGKASHRITKILSEL